jgi:hypothetical protein
MRYVRKHTDGRPDEWFPALADAMGHNECLSASYVWDDDTEAYDVASKDSLIRHIINTLGLDHARASLNLTGISDGAVIARLQNVGGERLWDIAYPDGDPYADMIVDTLAR